jgi:hypothetical protein
MADEPNGTEHDVLLELTHLSDVAASFGEMSGWYAQVPREEWEQSNKPTRVRLIVPEGIWPTQYRMAP